MAHVQSMRPVYGAPMIAHQLGYSMQPEALLDESLVAEFASMRLSRRVSAASFARSLTTARSLHASSLRAFCAIERYSSAPTRISLRLRSSRRAAPAEACTELGIANGMVNDSQGPRNYPISRRGG
jgi:hypothetical protein